MSNQVEYTEIVKEEKEVNQREIQTIDKSTFSQETQLIELQNYDQVDKQEIIKVDSSIMVESQMSQEVINENIQKTYENLGTCLEEKDEEDKENELQKKDESVFQNQENNNEEQIQKGDTTITITSQNLFENKNLQQNTDVFQNIIDTQRELDQQRFLSKIKCLDIYRKLPSDLKEQTISGAIISIVTLLIIIIIFICEFKDFERFEESNDAIQVLRINPEKVEINLDIDLVKLPCDILSFDIHNILGSETVYNHQNLTRTRLSRNGDQIEQLIGDQKIILVDRNYERAVEAFNNGEGCNLSGFILVDKVPGNFHISSHAFGNHLPRIFQLAQINNLDLSHVINHLSFGEQSEYLQVKKIYQQDLSPLDGIKYLKLDYLKNIGINTNYYISAVPTIYSDASNYYHTYQYIFDSNTLTTNSLPNLKFQFDFSPFEIKYSLIKKSFFIQMLTAIGGVFSIAIVIDQVVYRCVNNILKQAQISQFP